MLGATLLHPLLPAGGLAPLLVASAVAVATAAIVDRWLWRCDAPAGWRWALDGAAWTLILVLGAVKFLAVEAEKAVLRHFGVQRL